VELADLGQGNRAVSLARGLRALLSNKPLHFVLGGVLLFAVAGAGVQREVIEPVRLAPEARAQVLAAWAAEVGREPAPAEIAALEQRELDDEVLFREALALGVDRRDPVVRQRLLLDMRLRATTWWCGGGWCS
jgi:peptidyl-prolyl cis-trans isomerase C